jgi:hypothetical protein
VEGKRQNSASRSRIENVNAMGTGGMRDELSTAPDVGGRQTRNQGAEFIIRNGEEHEVSRRDDLVRRA